MAWLVREPEHSPSSCAGAKCPDSSNPDFFGKFSTPQPLPLHQSLAQQKYQSRRRSWELIC